MAEVINLVAEPVSIVEINSRLPYIKSIAKEAIDHNEEINEWAGEFISSCIELNSKEVEEMLTNAFNSDPEMMKKMNKLTSCLEEMAGLGAIIDLAVNPIEVRFALEENSIATYAAWFYGDENITIHSKQTGIPM